MTIQFSLLGTGSSGGVPRIGNDWGNCDPDNPKNRRRRCSMLITSGAEDKLTSVLIDTGADMREQLLLADVQSLQAVLLTHSHADHIFGLDDLRQLWLRQREPVPVYLDEDTRDVVFSSFGYCFERAPDSSYPTFCTEHRVVSCEPVEIKGDGGVIRMVPFQVEHGDIHALGVRVGNVAYVPDVKTVKLQESRAQLDNLDILILDSLRYKEHPTHMNVDEALAFIEVLKPKRAILTNMHTDLDYETLRSALPGNVEPAYDGMTFSAPS